MDVQVIPCANTLASGVGRFDIGTAEEIIHADFIVVCQTVEDAHGDVQPAQLVVGICGLMDLEHFGQILLLQVPVFPQVPESVCIHVDHPCLIMR